ncbi:GGDEF domain-containing protein [Saccharopolyspora griseoalba]|uniref:GGDEF domain-containing protein n=1 Tax=Saccharopolyspora griseoalba TaxID=1431848 RepID=A0ABW2LUP4_9PSEU
MSGWWIPNPRSARGVPIAATATAVAVAGWAATAHQLRRCTRQLAETQRDPVTGLLTRAAWEHAAARIWCARSGLAGVIDLDDFKQVNDTYGHQVGDAVLRVVGHRLTRCLDQVAVLGRLGGDELAFATRTRRGLIQPEALQAALSAPIHLGDALTLKVGASLGISAAPALPDALAAADAEMYQAKRRTKQVRS